MPQANPARERYYSAWAKTVPVGADRTELDARLDEVKASALALLRRRGGLGTTFGTLAAATRCYDGPSLLAVLQELMDAGEAEERPGPSAVLYVSTKPWETAGHRTAYRIHATPAEYAEIIHLLGALRNETNPR